MGAPINELKGRLRVFDARLLCWTRTWKKMTVLLLSIKDTRESFGVHRSETRRTRVSRFN